MVELSRDELRRLYEDDLLTDTEIAERYGTYQAKISRMRAALGIQTISKSMRAGRGLPDLTALQEELLVGSLLGDGSMSTTGGDGARFSEGHAEHYAAYTEWKARAMEPFTSAVYWGLKRENGREFRSRSFSTVSCTQLRPLYDLFYPPPTRRRVFPDDLVQLLTPFALAVWYMDDGSVTPTGSARISFGLSSTSLRRAKQALCALGLAPRVYGNLGNQEIHFPKQEREFLALVEPHIIPEMAYKLPRETPRRKIDRNARVLTPERAATLYEAGLTKEQIASAYDVGSSTVGRRLAAAGVAGRRSGPRCARWTSQQARKALEGYDPVRWKALGEDSRQTWLEDIFSVLRGMGFPEPRAWTTDQALRELNNLRSAEMYLRDGDVQPRLLRGIQLCNAYFPNRYRASWRGSMSAFEAWHDDAKLRWAIRFQLDHGDPVTPGRVLRALTMQYRTPTIFRPAVARFIYERYANPGDTVWDPCAGYGGRLLGALAARVRYVGTEVEPETVEGNRRLAAGLQMADAVEVHRQRAETFDPPPVAMVFTSPPYMDVERYSDSGEQSWRFHGEDWVGGFLRPIIRSARRVLGGGHLVLNVADIRKRGETYPLTQVVQDVAVEDGFELVETLRMPLSALNRQKPWEPILVFR